MLIWCLSDTTVKKKKKKPISQRNELRFLYGSKLVVWIPPSHQEFGSWFPKTLTLRFRSSGSICHVPPTRADSSWLTPAGILLPGTFWLPRARVGAPCAPRPQVQEPKRIPAQATLTEVPAASVPRGASVRRVCHNGAHEQRYCQKCSHLGGERGPLLNIYAILVFHPY